MEVLQAGKEIHMKMSLDALRKIAEYIVTNPMMKKGDNFTITGTDQSRIVMHLQ